MANEYIKTPLVWDNSVTNLGGFKNRIAFIPASEVVTTPVLAASGVKATGKFTYKNGSGAKYVYATEKTVGYKAESQGDVDGQSFKISGEFFFPGALAEAAAFARYVNTNPGYLVIEDHNGQQILIGQPNMTARIKPGADLGKASTDRKGFTFTFEAESLAPMIILENAASGDESTQKINFEELMKVTA